jgi:hypothetical protein
MKLQVFSIIFVLIETVVLVWSLYKYQKCWNIYDLKDKEIGSIAESETCLDRYYTVKGICLPTMFVILAVALLVSNCFLNHYLRHHDPGSSKEKTLQCLSAVFTVCYLLRAIQLLVINIFDDTNFVPSVFATFAISYLGAILWDMPAILSTVYLNYLLLKELRQDKKESSIYDNQKRTLLRDIERVEEFHYSVVDSDHEHELDSQHDSMEDVDEIMSPSNLLN